jgi:acyl transferase domain-containing protein
MNSVEESQGSEAIAVIGMAGRFPGARNVDDFWNNIRIGRVSTTTFSREELEEAGEDPQLMEDPEYVPVRAVLEGVELFDAKFFGFSPREARILDPQQRLFLECAWEALEDAGYDAERFAGRIGVFGGTGMNTYLWQNLRGGLFEAPLNDLEARLSNDKDFLTTWVSYKLNLRGPSISVQTACSTSLVAVHEACQSLLSHETDMALAGGVTVVLPQVKGYLAKEGSVFSRDGRCLPFDSRASGFVGGSGVGLVVMRRLSEALEAGDSIVGAVRGSAVNNDGARKVGYTAPSVEGQARVISESLELADLSPETIDYVEAHGTGTAIGDPMEVEALTKAFASTRRQSCALGSVKANIGHVDAAAGVASLIKVLLAMKHGLIPPSSYFEAPNPLIDFNSGPFFVNREPLQWELRDRPRRAGVSSFGMGGTNAHVVLESPPSVSPTSGPARTYSLFTLSARSGLAVKEAASRLASHIERSQGLGLADAAYTSNMGRQEMPYRLTAAGQSREEAVERLRDASPSTNPAPAEPPPLIFLFPGQGEQRIGMAADLWENVPVFRAELDRCLEILAPSVPLDFRALLLSSPSTFRGDPAALDRTEFAQPALFSMEYALARLWMSWGVQADLMLGHSLGEYVAACLADVFSLEDALNLIAARGRLMQALPPGAMVAIAASEGEVAPLLDVVDLAAVNGKKQVVLSGNPDALAGVEAALATEGTRFRRLKTSHAFHSRQMEPMIDAFRIELEKVHLGPPTMPFFSNVSGELISPTDAASPDYWLRHMRAPVRLLPSLEQISLQSPVVCLEVGPGATLGNLVELCFAQPGQVAMSSLPHRPGLRPDTEQLMRTCGYLWELGVPLSWSNFYRDEHRRRVSLPTYPFQRTHYWVDAPSSGRVGAGALPGGAGAPTADGAGPYDAEQARPAFQEDSIVTTISGVFREAFGIDEVGPEDDFFELGGNSLVATDVMHRLRRAFAAELPVGLLFEAPKVSELAAVIARHKGSQTDVDRLVAEIQELGPSEVDNLLSEEGLLGENDG